MSRQRVVRVRRLGVSSEFESLLLCALTAMLVGRVRFQGQMERRFGLTEITPVGVPRQEQVVAVGRVCCESAEGKINRASILLEVNGGVDRLSLSLLLLPLMTMRRTMGKLGTIASGVLDVGR